jgi:small-conductance mechanosensitive channel
MVYVSFNFAYDTLRLDAEQIRFFLTLVFGMVLIPGAYILSSKYDKGELMFNTAGGNSRLQAKCRLALLCDSLLHFDLQLNSSTKVFYLENVLDDCPTSALQFYSLSFGFVLTLLWFLLGFFAIRLENRTMTKFLVHDAMRITTYVCVVLSILVRILVALCTWFVSKNFNTGVKQTVFGSSAPLRAGLNSDLSQHTGYGTIQT